MRYYIVNAFIYIIVDAQHPIDFGSTQRNYGIAKGKASFLTAESIPRDNDIITISIYQGRMTDYRHTPCWLEHASACSRWREEKIKSQRKDHLLLNERSACSDDINTHT